ncbi:MAG TPA: choice-of-anchor Q domain-containing protein, partial [Solirubrobacter sp.]|nr:choice-of-anchor Q domain-containing protein [Solirubrobacter sp.]
DNDGAACDGLKPGFTSHNVVDDASCALDGDGNQQNVDPRLAPFDNGVFPLQAGSPALDSADPEYCPSDDQLGTPRPQGPGCDVGAYEGRDATPPAAPTISGPEDVQASTVTLAGQAEPGSVVTIYDRDAEIGSTRAGDDGAWTFTVSDVSPGEHAYSAVARDGAGNVSARSPVRIVRVSQPPQSTPTPAPTPIGIPTTTLPPPPPSPPTVGRTVNVETKSGTIRIRLPGTKKFVVLGPGQQIPVGTTIDSRKGRITLTSAANKKGKTQTADFYKGVFKILQRRKGKRPVTELKLTEKLACGKSNKKAKKAHAARKHKGKKRKRSRRLWGSGKGRFRTTGKFSSATVRGTTWLTHDRCGSTVTRVKSGVVKVRDRVKRKTVVVKAHHHYVARARKHR